MNDQQRKCPITFCEKFTRDELADLKSKQIWNSWHPVMERILSRTEEMRPVYLELASAKGVWMSKSCSAFRLILEAIWASGELFNHEKIRQKKDIAKELENLHRDISTLAGLLSEKLRYQRELIETEGFSRNEYLGCVDLLTRASRGNGHFTSWIRDPLERLDGQFDGKYWPTPEDVVAAIGEFEAEQSLPKQHHLPDEVMAGRSSVLKDFVLGLDKDLADTHQIPSGFRLSNASMATITNIALDLQVDSLATEDAIRVIRHRRKSGKY